MKFILAAFFLVLFSVTMSAQNVRAIQNIGAKAEGRAAVAANSPWLGAQVGYVFGGSEEPTDNLLVSGRILYEIDINAGKFHLPVMGNISALRSPSENEDPQKEIDAKISEILNSTQGANVGLFPYYEVVTKERFTLTLHGGLSWKFNAIDNDQDEVISLHQLRASVGFDMTVGKSNNNKLPLLLSFAPVITTFSEESYRDIFNENKSSLSSYELTVVIPIADATGFFTEAILGDNSAFRAGIVFAVER